MAGIKPANIVACYKDKILDVHAFINKLNQQLNCKDIYFEILCECEKRVLLMVYRSKVLSRYLRQQEIRNLLCDFGYDRNADLSEDIMKLKSRIDNTDFPHEIGAFLGYPVHDIYGFIYHRDVGCLLTGEWKVYKDADSARTMFVRYRKCRRALLARLDEGKTLAQIFCAA